MSFFKPKQPILQKKQISSATTREMALMRCIRIKAMERFRLSGIYTCVDQAMLIWSMVTAIIFISAQFLPFSWMNQAIFWSILTLIGILAMVTLTYSWTILEKISWLLYSWSFLMIVGLVITDCAIAYNWGFLLMHLCDFWLLLSALGYVMTGWMMRSRAFFLAAIIHSLTIFILPSLSGWQFGITGLVMMSNLLIFAEGQWDMLLPRQLKEYSSIRVNHLSPSYFVNKNHFYMG